MAKRKSKLKAKFKPYSGKGPWGDFPDNSPLRNAPSCPVRVTGALPPRGEYDPKAHTVAPAYNKGAYQVVSPNDLKVS